MAIQIQKSRRLIRPLIENIQLLAGSCFIPHHHHSRFTLKPSLFDKRDGSCFNRLQAKGKTGMKTWMTVCFIGLTALSVGPKALSAVPESSATAPLFLLAGAPTFDMSISDFREKIQRGESEASAE